MCAGSTTSPDENTVIIQHVGDCVASLEASCAAGRVATRAGTCYVPAECRGARHPHEAYVAPSWLGSWRLPSARCPSPCDRRAGCAAGPDLSWLAARLALGGCACTIGVGGPFERS